MNWFKFYGQDFLTDMKMSQLSIAERLMWVTMLALAHSENRSGNISYCNESLLKAKLGLLESDREWDEMNGFLDLFEKLDMIEKTDNGVRLINFEKRQQMQFTPAEKQARYREKHKESNESNQAKVTSVTADKNRIDKNRIDKNRIDKIREDKISISKEIGANAPKPKRGREDVSLVIEGIKKIVSILDGSQKEQRFMVKNFIDSKAPEILRQSGVINPTAEQIHNAIYRIFQLAKKDEFHSKNCTSIKYVYNKAGSIVMSSKKRKEVWVC